MYVTPETFRQQLDWMVESFRVLPVGEIVDRVQKGQPLPQKALGITFDDGWRDNFEFAFPELVSRGLPATIFLVTSRVGTRGAFWPDEVARRFSALDPSRRPNVLQQLRAPDGVEGCEQLLLWLKELRDKEREACLHCLREIATGDLPEQRELLNWDEVGSMASRGIDLESHGETHALLPGLDKDDLLREFSGSRDALRERGLGRQRLFAYPSGAWDAAAKRAAEESGYRAAFVVRRGTVSSTGDPMELPRLGLHQDISCSRSEFHRIVPGSAWWR
jgi:peptidoglycan/xylan/chitin deacetylase (PgdA/CDA1 family)